MGLEVRYLKDKHIIETILNGVIEKNEFVVARGEAQVLAKANNCFHFLTDLTSAKLHFSVLDIWNIPYEIEDFKKPLGIERSKLKGAILIVNYDTNLKLIDNLFQKKGLTAKIFFNRDEALTWLKCD